MGTAEPQWNPSYGQRYQRALRKMSPIICQVSFIVSVESVFYGECTWHPVWSCPRYFDADGWMPIKDIAPIIAQVTDHFGSDIFIPISTFSSHAQHGVAWKLIMKYPNAVSRIPFQSIRNVAELDLSSCNLNGEFRLCTPHPDLPSIVTHRLAFLSKIVPVG